METAASGKGKRRRVWRTVCPVVGYILLAPALLWSLGLCIYEPVCLPAALPVLTAWVVLRHRPWTQLWLWGLVFSMCCAYTMLPPPAPEQWQTPWAKAPSFTIQGDMLTILNLRDFRYRTEDDYDVCYRTETYDLSTLTGVSFAECHWDGMEAICHTMLSFDFADGRHLVISPETRLPAGVEQNAIGGLYKQYGLLYIFGTEEDIFALRTNYRHEDLLLMPLNVTPTQARGLLLDMVHRAEMTEAQHLPYNTLSRNCSTGILGALVDQGAGLPTGYRLLPVHNGSISKVLYENGLLHTLPGESYNALRARTYLHYDLAPGHPELYSQAIRRKIGGGRD